MSGPEPGPVEVGLSPGLERLLIELGLGDLYGLNSCPAEPAVENVSHGDPVPDPADQVCRAYDPDALPWTVHAVTKWDLIALINRTTFVYDNWQKAVKEAEAGKGIAKQGGAKAIESIVGAPPILSGKYSKDNAAARAWVDARSNELMWQEFEQRAAKNDFPAYKDSGGMGNMGAKFVENGAYRKTAENLKDGFLGPGYQKADSPDPSYTRYVSADGSREVRMVNDGREKMEMLKLNEKSVDAVRIYLD